MLVLANILQPLIWLFDTIMTFFHDHAGGSWGLSIIFLTVVVRAALIPLTLKQYHSMQALQRVQPEMKKLQEKYKDDKQRLNQEMMKFYQENGVNPLASCLPLAAQLPVFISLFYMLRHDLRQDICGQTAHACGHAAKFLFIPDLTDKATGGVLITLLILYAGSQLLSGVMMLATNPDKSQRTLMLVLPLIFVPIVINFPAGVIVYWITTNFWTIVQQYIVRRRLGPMRPAVATAGAASPAVAGTGGDGGSSSGGGGLLARARAAVEGAAGTSTATKEKPAATKAKAKAGGSNGRGAGAAPPPPPRKKKKRSGRRR